MWEVYDVPPGLLDQDIKRLDGRLVARGQEKQHRKGVISDGADFRVQKRAVTPKLDVQEHFGS